MTTTTLSWVRHPNARPDIQADIVSAGPYVISCRTDRFTLSYRPDGQHIPLGFFETLEGAKSTAAGHRDLMTVTHRFPAGSEVRYKDQTLTPSKKARPGFVREVLVNSYGNPYVRVDMQDGGVLDTLPSNLSPRHTPTPQPLIP